MHGSKIARALGLFLVAAAPAALWMLQPQEPSDETGLASFATFSAPHDEEPLAFETLSRGAIGPWRCPEAALLRSEAEWDAWIDGAIDDCLYLRPPAPRLDWDSHMLVVLALGEKRTAGYAVDVVDVRRHGSLLHVDALEKDPGPEAQQLVFTTPFHVVSVERSAVDEIHVSWVAPDSATAERRATWGWLKGRAGR